MPNSAQESLPLSRVVSLVLLALLALLFAGAGVAHFVRSASFVDMVPTWLPAPARLVALSGVAELLGAIGIMVPFTRRAAGWGLIALLVAVFPANVHMLTRAIAQGSGIAWLIVLAIRLPVQPVLIWWVWWAAIKRSRDRE